MLDILTASHEELKCGDAINYKRSIYCGKSSYLNRRYYSSLPIVRSAYPVLLETKYYNCNKQPCTKPELATLSMGGGRASKETKTQECKICR